MDTLPEQISPALLEFCARIAPGMPLFIPSQPIEGAILSACIRNSQEKARISGGSVVYGWAIWHLQGYFFEAEHHGVWLSPEGALIDVSPQYMDYPKILFLRDDTAVYDPKSFRANVIAPAADTAIAKEAVQHSRRRNEIINSYRSDEFVTFELNAADQAEIDTIDKRLAELIR